VHPSGLKGTSSPSHLNLVILVVGFEVSKARMDTLQLRLFYLKSSSTVPAPGEGWASLGVRSVGIPISGLKYLGI